MVIIGSARHDERGKYSGGKAGDQTQKIENGYDMTGEVSTQAFYNHSKGWVILRAKDKNLASGLAFCMAIACVNKNIGYSQSDRGGVIKYGILTEKPCNADCSTLVRACIKQCGYDVPNFTTANEVKVLTESGLFEKVEFSSVSGLYDGDVLVTKTKGHTAIVVAGALSRSVVEKNPYKEPTNTVRKGSKGESVKWIQWALNKHGANLTIDGDFGNKTYLAVKAFQNAHGLTVDGIVGVQTRVALK